MFAVEQREDESKDPSEIVPHRPSGEGHGEWPRRSVHRSQSHGLIPRGEFDCSQGRAEVWAARPRQVTYFVQKKGSSACGLKGAFAIIGCSGEGPANVTKEFALHKALAESAAIDRNKGAAAATRHLVNGLSKHVLATSGRSSQQNGKTAIAQYWEDEAIDRSRSGFCFAVEHFRRRLGTSRVKQSSEFPICNRSPSFSRASKTRAPLTNVPLRLRKSRIRKPCIFLRSILA